MVDVVGSTEVCVVVLKCRGGNISISGVQVAEEFSCRGFSVPNIFMPERLDKHFFKKGQQNLSESFVGDVVLGEEVTGTLIAIANVRNDRPCGSV